MEMILTGDPMNAQEAFSRGLVSKIVEPKDCEKEAIDIAKKISQYSLLASILIN
jgi:enoyl-CoA hydratase/carnithine racemase